MKKLLFLFGLIIPFIVFYPQEQHTYGPNKENIYYSWVKPSSAPAYQWIEDHQVGSLIYNGQVWQTRSINSWSWTYADIPTEATVTSVNIKFRAYYSYSDDFHFTLHNIGYLQGESEINFYEECNINTKILDRTLIRDASGFYYFNETFFAGDVYSAIVNAVQSGNFHLTLGINREGSSPAPPFDLLSYSGGSSSSSPAIDLTINYTTPNQYLP